MDELQKEAKNKYFDPYQKVWATKIMPGEFHVSAGDELIVTTLGSCISACIRDIKIGIGGMNHFMLPTSNKGEWAGKNASTRFGNFAMEYLINEILKNGGLKENMQASILGGGIMFKTESVNAVGKKNIDFAKEYLATEKIPIIYEDVGGEVSRKVYFTPKNGKIIVKKLTTLHNDTIIKREKILSKDISQKPTTGGVEIF